MRAYCLNLYDDDDKHVGDIWLSKREGHLNLDTQECADCVELGVSNVRVLREACSAFLREIEATT